MADWQESRVIDKKVWNDELFSLTFDTELLPFKAGQFIKVGLDVDGERIERPYSLVNAPDETPGEIYFNLVDEGPLTRELANIEPGDSIWVTRDAHGFLVLEEVPQSQHLWMMATGTGLGPFLSMLKSGEAIERFEKIVLVHGGAANAHWWSHIAPLFPEYCVAALDLSGHGRVIWNAP